MRPTGK